MRPHILHWGMCYTGQVLGASTVFNKSQTSHTRRFFLLLDNVMEQAQVDTFQLGCVWFSHQDRAAGGIVFWHRSDKCSACCSGRDSMANTDSMFCGMSASIVSAFRLYRYMSCHSETIVGVMDQYFCFCFRKSRSLAPGVGQT